MFVHGKLGVNRSGDTAPSQETPEMGPRLHFVGLPSWRALGRELALVVAVLLAAILVLRGPSVDQGFSIDESRWISTSRYFWVTFIDRNLFGPAWQPNYIVYTHPPVGRYVIGFGLWLQGWQPDQLNGRYDSLESRLYNERM